MTTEPHALTPENFAATRERMLAMRGSGSRRYARITADHLIAAGASEVLALDPAALRVAVALASAPTDKLFTGRTVALADEDAGEPAREATIGVVAIEGPLAQRAHLEFVGECGAVFVDGYDFVAERVRAAVAEPAVDALVLRIDSPGGDVAGIEEALGQASAAIAASGKPVVVYIDELAASAGYWLACGLATDGVFAPVAGRIGSIGAIGAVISESRALELIGIDVAIIADPEGKAEGHPATPISKKAVERVRARVGQCAARFFDAVATARALTVKDVKALDGEVLLAADALAKGLIDGVQSFEATVALAAKKGREARQKREETMQTEKELARLQAFEKSVQAVTGTTDGTAAVAKIEALKIENERAQASTAKVAELEAKVTALETAKAEGDLAALVDQAVVDGKIAPAKRDGFLADARAKGGVSFAEAVLAHLTPNPVVTTGEKGGSPPVVPAKVEATDAALAKLGAKVGLTDEDFKAAKADGVL